MKTAVEVFLNIDHRIGFLHQGLRFGKLLNAVNRVQNFGVFNPFWLISINNIGDVQNTAHHTFRKLGVLTPLYIGFKIF